MDTNKMPTDLPTMVMQAIADHPGYPEFASWCESQLIHPCPIYFMIWQASREAVVLELGAPSHWVADYAACGGGMTVFDAEKATKVTDPMCSKTPSYTIHALEKAGLKVSP